MPKGKSLTSSEQEIINFLFKRGISNRQIAREISRSHSVVNAYLKSPQNYGKIKRPGRKPSLSRRSENEIFRKATKENKFASQIKEEMGLNLSNRQIRRIIRKNGHAKFTKMLQKTGLKPRHIEARLAWAKKYIDLGEKWKQVIFTDEKKFNLDGPDGFKYYWHDLRDEPKTFMSRNFGGGSIMIWGAFSYNGKIRLRFVSNKMNSDYYINMLDNTIDELEAVGGENFIFQQDNASIHISKKSKQWFQEHEFQLLEWPACSPDLNPIENLWGIIARKVYGNSRQYQTIAELKVAILQSWLDIRSETLRNLVDSMKDRLFDVILKKGKQIGR